MREHYLLNFALVASMAAKLPSLPAASSALFGSRAQWGPGDGIWIRI